MSAHEVGTAGLRPVEKGDVDAVTTVVGLIGIVTELVVEGVGAEDTVEEDVAMLTR